MRTVVVVMVYYTLCVHHCIQVDSYGSVQLETITNHSLIIYRQYTSHSIHHTLRSLTVATWR